MTVKYTISLGGVGVSLVHTEKGQELDTYDTYQEAQEEIDNESKFVDTEDWYIVRVVMKDGNWCSDDFYNINYSQMARDQ